MEDPFGDGREGFLPGDALPLSFSSSSNPFERVEKPVWMVEPLHLGDPFAADRPPVQGRIRVSFDLDDLSVFHVDPQAASPVVHPSTIGFYDHYFSLEEQRGRAATKMPKMR
jgi:hypothetical protein